MEFLRERDFGKCFYRAFELIIDLDECYTVSEWKRYWQTFISTCRINNKYWRSTIRCTKVSCDTRRASNSKECWRLRKNKFLPVLLLISNRKGFHSERITKKYEFQRFRWAYNNISSSIQASRDRAFDSFSSPEINIAVTGFDCIEPTLPRFRGVQPPRTPELPANLDTARDRWINRDPCCATGDRGTLFLGEFDSCRCAEDRRSLGEKIICTGVY